jgi:hypothetical protein
MAEPIAIGRDHMATVPKAMAGAERLAVDLVLQPEKELAPHDESAALGGEERC